MRKQKGYAIPLTLLVAGVTLTMGMAGANLSSGDLNMANHQYHQERARQLAEIGLEKLTYSATPASRDYPGLVSSHPDDQVHVEVFDNRDGSLAADSGCPIECPVGCMYWVATAQARSGQRVLAEARVGSLVRAGMSAGSSGAQVRFLQATSGIHYRSVDGTGAPLSGQDIAATNVTNSTETPGDSFLSLARAISLQNPDASLLDGKVKHAPGLAFTDITDVSDAALVTDTGGQFALPAYAPPLLSHLNGSQEIASSQALASGRYDTLTLRAGSQIDLNGVYHIRKLVIGSGGARLFVPSGNQAQLFIDEVQFGADFLEYQNDNPSKHLRIELAPVAAYLHTLKLRAVQSGKALVMAPGYNLWVTADANKTIQGSLFAQQVKLDLPSGGDFVYDRSTETRPRTSEIIAYGMIPVGQYWSLSDKHFL